MDEQLLIICWFDVVRSTDRPRGAVRAFVDDALRLVTRVFRLPAEAKQGDSFCMYADDPVALWEAASRVSEEATSWDLSLRAALHIGYGSAPLGEGFHPMMAQAARILEQAGPDECLMTTGVRDLLSQLADLTIPISDKRSREDPHAPLWGLRLGGTRLRMYRVPSGAIVDPSWAAEKRSVRMGAEPEEAPSQFSREGRVRAAP